MGEGGRLGGDDGDDTGEMAVAVWRLGNSGSCWRVAKDLDSHRVSMESTGDGEDQRAPRGGLQL
jgi:hypothetical protein